MAAPAQRVRDRIGPWATVTDDGAGCRVRIEADDLDWAAAALGLTGAPFSVLSPPELKDHLRDLAARYAAAGAP